MKLKALRISTVKKMFRRGLKQKYRDTTIIRDYIGFRNNHNRTSLYIEFSKPVDKNVYTVKFVIKRDGTLPVYLKNLTISFTDKQEALEYIKFKTVDLLK